MGNTNDDTNPRSLRERLGFSLDEAGRRAGIERSRLSRYERAYLRLRGDEVMRLARVLGVSQMRLPSLLKSPRSACRKEHAHAR